ncbi:hypothetical protein EYC84_000508 [Monilinia fructicola]|uniref:Uncharacterized protein n=1 Tax=Monilinia fructicola TaxID=38448 RepID=A0A5M9JTI6_MONFR|nr:hypothetical protein EYC84_000508 [Monilinia fructicola]
MNTSVLCNFVERSEYPAICAGSAPWSTSISLRSADDNMYTLYAQRYFNGLELKVCVPGDRFMYPWSVDTTTQTIEEELYFDISLNGSYFKTDSPYLQNYTQRCTANTTAGYFNFPTYSNNNLGPLLPADAFVYVATTSQATHQ